MKVHIVYIASFLARAAQQKIDIRFSVLLGNLLNKFCLAVNFCAQINNLFDPTYIQC